MEVSARAPFINANKLSALRMFLTPLICLLLLIPDQSIRIATLCLYMFTAITDYLDGVLARKYGESKFGALLDHFSDKIFTVLFFATLAYLGFIPFFIAALLIIRDPIINGFKFLSRMKGFEIEVTGLAKYKTALQMVGGGYLIFIRIVPESFTALAIMAAVVLGSLAVFLFHLAFQNKFRARQLTTVFFTFLALLVRAALPLEITSLVFAYGLLAFAWVSALHYIVVFFIRLPKGRNRLPAGWVLQSLLENLLLPAILLFLLSTNHFLYWIPLAVMIIEFITSACNHIVATYSLAHDMSIAFIKLLLQYFFIALILLQTIYSGPWIESPIYNMSYLLGTTLMTLAAILLRHGEVILEHITEE